MKFLSLPLPSFRHALPFLLGLFAGPACSDDETAPAPVPDFGIAVQSIDGYAPDGEVPLACDGRLAVTVTVSTSIANAKFQLRPANACGISKRCGYVRVEALSADDAVLTHTDSVTTTGLLELGGEQRSALSKLRVSLVSGVDQTIVVNKDLTEVTALVEPTFTLASDCEAPTGNGGQGGAPAGGAGGAEPGGAVTGGASGAGGAEGGAGAGGAATDLGGAPNDVGGAGGAQ